MRRGVDSGTVTAREPGILGLDLLGKRGGSDDDVVDVDIARRGSGGGGSDDDVVDIDVAKRDFATMTARGVSIGGDDGILARRKAGLISVGRRGSGGGGSDDDVVDVDIAKRGSGRGGSDDDVVDVDIAKRGSGGGSDDDVVDVDIA